MAFESAPSAASCFFAVDRHSSSNLDADLAAIALESECSTSMPSLINTTVVNKDINILINCRVIFSFSKTYICVHYELTLIMITIHRKMINSTCLVFSSTNARFLRW